MVSFDFLYYNPKTKNFKTTEVWNAVLFLSYNFKNKSGLYSFLDQFLDWFKTGSILYIDNSHEFCNFQIEIDTHFRKRLNPFEWIIDYTEERKINKKSIQILSGNLNVNAMEEKYRHLILPVLPFATFPDYCYDYNFLHNRKFDKKFICVMGKIRENRKELFNFLNKNGILENSFYSYNTVWSKKEEPIHYLEDESFTNSKENHELISYFQKGGVDYLQKSFLNIVSETFFYNSLEQGDPMGQNVFYISEKIFKPLCYCQPFILLSKSKSLNFLKELGFKTFDRWWDESYDDIEDDEIRFEEIKKQISFLNTKTIKELKDMYNEMIPILKHNYDLTWKIYDESDFKIEFKNYMFNDVVDFKEQKFKIKNKITVTVDKDEYVNHQNEHIVI